MKVKRLEINNFRGFRHAEIDFPDSNLAVFIGTNGKGKSSVLDLVAMFLSGVVDKLGVKTTGFSLSENDINNEESLTSNRIKLGLGNEEFNWENHESRLHGDGIDDVAGFNSLVNEFLMQSIWNSDDENIPMLVFFKASRSFNNQNDLKQSENLFPVRQFKAYENAFSKTISDFNSFLGWFRNEEDKENELIRKEQNFALRNPQLEPVRSAIHAFFGKLEGISFENLRVERDFPKAKNFASAGLSTSLVISKNKTDLRLEQLSDGEKMLVMVVSDIARRLSIANPSLADPLEGKGIVLIDEIELHLHPKWQREVVPALLATFPNIQFLVTTHSPQVLSRIDKSDIFMLEEGQIFRLGSNPLGRDSNSILEEIMDTPSEPAEVEALEKQLFAHVQQKHFDKALKIRSKILEKSPDNTAIFQADAMMKRLQVLSQ